MAEFSTLTSVAITAPTGVTLTNIVSGGYSGAVEKLLRHYDKPLPKKTLGNLDISVTIVTTDANAVKLCDGLDVEGVTLTFGAAMTTIDPDDFTLSGKSDVLTFTVSDMYVDGPIDVNASNEGKDLIEYTINLKAQLKPATGALPTITRTFTPAV